MRRQLRALILLGVLFAVSVAVLAIPRLEFEVLGRHFDRGTDDTVLGLQLGLDLKGGSHLVYKAVRTDGEQPTRDDLEGVRRVLEKRVNQFGLSEPTIQLLGNPPDRVLLQLPGLSGASVAVRFEGDTVSPGEFEEFLRSPEIGHPEATVIRGDDESLIATLDELRPARRDAFGAVTQEAEGDAIRTAIEDRFSVTVLLSFIVPQEEEEPAAEGEEEAAESTDTEDEGAAPEAEPGEGADDEEPAGPPPPLVTTEDIQAALDAFGRADSSLAQTADNVWTLELRSVREPGLDDEGKKLPSEIDNLRTAMEEIGDLALFGVVGVISEYSVGGGIQEAKHLIGQTAQLEFRERICGALGPPAPGIEWPPDGLTEEEWVLVRCSDPQYYSEQDLDLSGSDLTNAYAGTQPNIIGPVVNIEFNSKGADEFYEVTERISRLTNRDVLAIYLDGDELVAPSASTGISGGRAYITGAFTPERARTIAIQLRSGALPVELELIQERNVDATLGADSLRKSVIAGAVGMLLVLVFMIVYYRAPGVVAALALMLYAALLLAIFKTVPVTLTLSGVAALVLSIGLAVDANILIAERTKEELRMGRGLLAAITSGFDRAWPSIRDSNISTIITCVVLFWFGERLGTSLIQGFALTLAVGVLVSMFTAYFASRVIMRTLAATPLGRRLTLFVPVGGVGTDRPVGVTE